VTQTTCPLHINSKNSEKGGDCDDGNNIPFSQRDLPPSLSYSPGILKWENGIDKNIYRFLFLSLTLADFLYLSLREKKNARKKYRVKEK
jgi:hypothetical protein